MVSGKHAEVTLVLMTLEKCEELSVQKQLNKVVLFPSPQPSTMFSTTVRSWSTAQTGSSKHTEILSMKNLCADDKVMKMRKK